MRKSILHGWGWKWGHAVWGYDGDGDQCMEIG